MKLEMRADGACCPDVETMRKIAAVLRYAAKEEGVPRCFMVTVGFCDDETIHRFNRRFRQVDRATDVLSFPLTEGRSEWQQAAAVHGGPRPSLGDILISMEHCAAQAASYGHGFEREICFLALHGFLHLLGYDHMEAAEGLVMEATAEKYLSALGVIR